MTIFYKVKMDEKGDWAEVSGFAKNYRVV